MSSRSQGASFNLQISPHVFDTGYEIYDHVLPNDHCRQLLEAIHAHCQHQSHTIPRIARVDEGDTLPLSWSYIKGSVVRHEFPAIYAMYTHVLTDLNRINPYTSSFIARQDEDVALNINLNVQGEGNSWHYDGNDVACLIYLDEVIEGGELQFYPMSYPLYIADLDRTNRQPVSVKPCPGRAVVLLGGQSLHRVAPVTAGDRVAIVMSFLRSDSPLQRPKNYYQYLQNAQGFDDKYAPVASD